MPKTKKESKKWKEKVAPEGKAATVTAKVKATKTTQPLTEMKCVACEAGMPAMSLEKVDKYLSQTEGWSLEEESGHHQIVKQYKFRNFRGAMQFVAKVAEIAEHEGHHPNIFISYNRVRLALYTHAIDGLHENDFIVAAKVDAALRTWKGDA